MPVTTESIRKPEAGPAHRILALLALRAAAAAPGTDRAKDQRRAALLMLTVGAA